MSNWKQSRQLGDWLLLANGIILVVLVNLIASSVFFRIDLTGEKRYTIKAPTKMLLRDLDDHVYIEVFLEGDLNPGFRRFRKSVGETLEEFRIYSNNKVHYTFTDPALARSDKARNEFMAGLASKGVHGMRVIDTKGGERTEKIVFPGALVSYNGFESGVMLLKGGRLDDISLSKYRETVDPTSPAIVLLSPSGSPHPFYAEFGWYAPAGATVKVPGADTIWHQLGTGSLGPGRPGSCPGASAMRRRRRAASCR